VLISDTMYLMEEAQHVNPALKFDLSLVQILFLPIEQGCRKKNRCKFIGLLQSLHSSHQLKVKLSLCLTEYHTMKMYWDSGGKALCILNLSARWR
jgi:hypothetical protein